MTPLNFAIVGLRLMAIYCFVQACLWFFQVAFFLTFLNQLKPSSLAANLLSVAVPAFLYLILGTVLFLSSPALGRKIVSSAPDEPKAGALSLEDVQAFLFAGAGLIILAMAFPNLGRAVQNIYFWFELPRDAVSGRSFLPTTDITYGVGVIGQLLLGLFLLLKPRAFRNAWHWLRTAGTRPNSD